MTLVFLSTKTAGGGEGAAAKWRESDEREGLCGRSFEAMEPRILVACRAITQISLLPLPLSLSLNANAREKSELQRLEEGVRTTAMVDLFPFDRARATVAHMCLVEPTTTVGHAFLSSKLKEWYSM